VTDALNDNKAGKDELMDLKDELDEKYISREEF